jgi:crotonobetainyl-CoA:carnitine CoA-transferase CaiB-like acyl-CoA transferase
MKPLEGLKVLELARILAGPWVGQLLADLGADVVKVERPGAGDDTRGWGPPFIEGQDGGDLSAAYFHACNRGKRSVGADFETPEGQDIVRGLAAHADVVIENFKVGGMGGIMDLTGDPEGEPQKVGVAYADIFTGVYSVVGILAALRRRDATGEGAHLDMALLDVQTSVLANQAMNYLASGKTPRRMGNAHPNIVPYQVFPVSDGHVIVAVGNDGQFARFAAVLGQPDLARDERFRTNAGRVRYRTELVPVLTVLTLRFSREALLSALETQGVPAGPINTVADVFADPQVVARGMRIDLPSAAARGGAIPSVRSPIVLDGEPMAAGRPSPRLGEHTQEVLDDPSWMS